VVYPIPLASYRLDVMAYLKIGIHKRAFIAPHAGPRQSSGCDRCDVQSLRAPGMHLVSARVLLEAELEWHCQDGLNVFPCGVSFSYTLIFFLFLKCPTLSISSPTHWPASPPIGDTEETSAVVRRMSECRMEAPDHLMCEATGA
jgi:hypothetical protein